MNGKFTLEKKGTFHKCLFNAMASPCEVLFKAGSEEEAQSFAESAFDETKRIEAKFSRYLKDNIIYQINNSDGAVIEVDDETARMFDFAGQCFKLSDGFFDITSGVLRRCWKFDGVEFAPDQVQLRNVLELIGWNKVEWDGKHIKLQSGMEIDFGGIGKEFAVDRVAEMAISFGIQNVMVNFGGDIRAIQKEAGEPWVIGIESPQQVDKAIGKIELNNGGVATSGDTKRFCLFQGQRLGHILNPKTGWPVENAPHAITVIGDNCTQAGILATMAMLKGGEAEEFLEAQSVTYNCIRE